MATKMKSTTVYLDPELVARVEVCANFFNLSRDRFIQIAVDAYLNRDYPCHNPCPVQETD
jgi:predicted transcriptional regulator